MFGFLWLVIILIIAVRVLNASKTSGQNRNRTGKGTQPNRPMVQRTQGKWSGGQGMGKQGGSYSQPARPAQPAGGYSQPARPAQPAGGYSQPARPAQPAGGYGQQRTNDRRYAMPARPVQSAAYPEKKKAKTENTILQKARANASEHFNEDTLEARGAAELGHVPQGGEIMRDKAMERHIHSEHGEDHGTELRNRPGVDDFDTWHLVDEVNDLIVKGYSGNLEFERDFLAEGLDMLNRVSM